MTTNKKYKLLLSISVSIVVLLLFFSFINNISQNSNFKKQNERILNLLDDNRKKIDLLENDIQKVNSSNNKVRSLLSLPYITLERENELSSREGTDLNNENISFYNAIDYFTIHPYIVNSENKLNSLLNSTKYKEFFKSRNIILKRKDSSTYLLEKNGNRYFDISIKDPEQLQILISNFSEVNREFRLNDIEENDNDFSIYLNSESLNADNHYKEYKSLSLKLENMLNEHSFLLILKNTSLELSEKGLTGKGVGYSIFNKDKTFIARLFLDKSKLLFFIDKDEYASLDILKKELLTLLDKSDKRTDEIRIVDEQKIKIERVLSDEAFKAYLDKNKFTVNMIPREDNDYFYYDIENSEGKLIGSFGVQKIIGDIYLLDSEDIMISSLKYFENDTHDTLIPEMEIPGNIAVIADKYSRNNSTTFVVIGSHENNADTIIIVHADAASGKTTLVAIPRDLYYQGRKINDYYRSFGGSRFIEILSDITGLSISGYIAVDMYAFIDLINILGGIDVYLKSNLIDPTYRVRDNGKWSTLYYEKGIHHLNGIEALRITRSRHTSSDFGRTSRQQLVLQGIKDKMTELDIGDLGTVLKLFQTLDKYMETNFSPVEMLGLFMKYRNTELIKKQGLSIFNVLYNTYTNIYKLEDKSKQYDEGFYRGYWILLPKNNDWNVIKWYIRTLISGDEE